MEDNEGAPPHFLETLRRVGAVVLAIFQNRLELLVVELHEERIRVFEALLLLVAIVVLGCFTLLVAAAAVIYLLWKQFGVASLFVLAGIGLIGTLILGWKLHLRLKNWPLLPGTLEQLKKDRECLENK